MEVVTELLCDSLPRPTSESALRCSKRWDKGAADALHSIAEPTLDSTRLATSSSPSSRSSPRLPTLTSGCVSRFRSRRFRRD